MQLSGKHEHSGKPPLDWRNSRFFQEKSNISQFVEKTPEIREKPADDNDFKHYGLSCCELASALSSLAEDDDSDFGSLGTVSFCCIPGRSFGSMLSPELKDG